MDLHAFLFELGIEELPDSVILPAQAALVQSFQKLCQDSRISYTNLSFGSTPRRLYLKASGLPSAQPDTRVVKPGPAVKIAYSPDGKLSAAGMGFLKKSGGTEQDIRILQTDKGDFISVDYVQPGKAMIDLLRDWIPTVIQQIPLPKKMVWCSTELAFSRPIRWLLTLFDSAIIPLDFFGIISGRETLGNRHLGAGKRIAIMHPDDYETMLKSVMVIADRTKRKQMIRLQMQELCSDGYQILEDERLLDTVTNLVEYPTAVLGSFASEFLSLPEKIITSTISQNQKYFSVFDSANRLTNRFVFISNGDPACSELIRLGNEKVVKARLEDAMWFFHEDTRRSLESHAEALGEVVFHSQLGSMAGKTARVVSLTADIADLLGTNEELKQLALRTATLCKADLVTLMLGEKEFTKLQGYIGMHYAMASGEDTQVAQGIYEHYMPRGNNDGLPETLCGKICAIADKMDTLCGIIGIGLMPTGSGDPFALRRAASGIVQIVAQSNWDIDVFHIANQALAKYSERVSLVDSAREHIHLFLKQRIVWLLKERGIPHDVIDSVMHVDMSHIGDLLARADALGAYKQHDDFQKLVTGFKRVANIIEATHDFTRFDIHLADQPAELALYEGLINLRASIGEALQGCDYPRTLDFLVSYGSLIDSYFDQILVNCEDPTQRDNHYALLHLIRQEFRRVADLSLIVMDNDRSGV